MLSTTSSRRSIRIARTLARRAPLRSLSTDPSPPPSAAPPQHAHPPAPKANPPGAGRSRALFSPTPRAAGARPAPPLLPYLSPTFAPNQRLSVPDEKRALLERVVGAFHAPVRYAFAYGSGVFAQAGYDAPGASAPMLDFVLAVSHAGHWHSINMQQFPGHYPYGMRLLGSDVVSRVQEMGPGVWFNTYVQMEGVTIKYGVVSVDTLCADLLNWDTLYLAGRMHKPLRIIKDDPRVRLTQQVNLVSAARFALLTLPAHFTSEDLFARIAGLSYAGDPRMLLPAESRAKVANIVHKQAPQFAELYRRLLLALPGVHWPAQGDKLEQDDSPRARAALVRKLPATLLGAVERRYAGAGGPAREADEAAYWAHIGSDSALPGILAEETSRIVRGPATVQSLKGLVSAGLGKSARYTAEKVGKWWRS